MWSFLSTRFRILTNWYYNQNAIDAASDNLNHESQPDNDGDGGVGAPTNRNVGVANREEHARRAWVHWRSLGSPRYVMAPMVDGSELAFRTLARRYGCELAYTPMLHSRLMMETEKYRRENFSTDSDDNPVVAQFCANDPEVLVRAARYVEGYVDAVDLNLGCPQGIAKRGHYGSFLQDEWDLLHQIVGTAARELKVPIWCKIRVFKDQNRTIAYARMLEQAGASLIAVHGRTREEKGKTAPPADWDAIKAVKQSVMIPVIANGNVLSRNDADEALKFTGADAVMSAYALLDNPALFWQGRGRVPSRLELLKEYLEIAEREETPMRMVRLHAFKLLRSRLDVAFDLNEEVAKCRSIQNFRDILEIIEQRTDYDGKSFEQRIADGEKVDAPVFTVKKRKLANRIVQSERRLKKRISQQAAVGISTS